MSDILNRSEVQKFIEVLTNPQNGEEYAIALNFWVTHISQKKKNDNKVAVLIYDAIKEINIERLRQFIQTILTLTPEQREQLRNYVQAELLNSRKDLAAVMGRYAKLEESHYFDEASPLEIQINELQVKITECETKIIRLEQKVEEHEESIQVQVGEWQEIQTERRDAFVEELKDYFKNTFQVDEKGNAIVGDNGVPVKAVIHDAKGKEVTMDPETDKERCEAVKAAISKTPPPDKVYKVTEGNVTAEQCSNTNKLTRAINVVMAVQALDPKTKDASSLHYEKHTSVSEVQTKIDKVRERGNVVERKREAYSKLNKAEVNLKNIEEQIKGAPEGKEKDALLSQKEKLVAEVDTAKKELDVIRKADAHNQKEIKSNFLAALNRMNGKDPDHPGLRVRPAPTFERFDGDKDKESEYEKNDVQKISDILDECKAKSGTQAELADAKHELHSMERDLKLLQDQKLEQEHGPGRGTGA